MFSASTSTACRSPTFRSPGGDPVIGDRAYGTEPGKVAAIAGAIARGLLAGGVLPVLKHLPGHGRATADSHDRLPVVDTDRGHPGSDRFCRLPAACRPAARHDRACCVFRHRPRRTGHHFGHNGARSDSRVYRIPGPADERRRLDEALSGTIAERSRAAFAAGCDVVLHCNGELDEMTAVAGEAPELAGEAAKRADAALGAAHGAGRVRCRCRAQDFHADGGRRAAADRNGRPVHERLTNFDTTLEAERGTTEPAMIVDVEGFEGPLDLLLALARQQKVDLAKISILALADQYLAFIEAARQLRLELAADYLVMAAWLAYLKSRLLLPEAAPGEGPSAEDMATGAGLPLAPAGGVPRRRARA